MTQPTLFTFANESQVERKIVRDCQTFDTFEQAREFAIRAHGSGEFVYVEFAGKTVATEREI